jgi:hypothetical protein
MRPVASRLPPRMSREHSLAAMLAAPRFSQTLAFDAEMFLTGGWAGAALAFILQRLLCRIYRRDSINASDTGAVPCRSRPPELVAGQSRRGRKVARATLAEFELGKRTPYARTLDDLQSALESAGVEFTERRSARRASQGQGAWRHVRRGPERFKRRVRQPSTCGAYWKSDFPFRALQ